jgi:hypothetical protein
MFEYSIFPFYLFSQSVISADKDHYQHKKPLVPLGRRFASWFHPTSLQIADCRLHGRQSEISNLKSRGSITGAARASILAVGRWGSGSEVVFAWPAAGSARSRWRILPEGCSRATRPRQRVLYNCQIAGAIIPRRDAACQVGQTTDSCALGVPML